MTSTRTTAAVSDRVPGFVSNVNSFRFDDLDTDAELYRPRFVRVSVPEFNP